MSPSNSLAQSLGRALRAKIRRRKTKQPEKPLLVAAEYEPKTELIRNGKVVGTSA